MRLLVTGGSSYLGRHLVPLALPRAELTYTYYSRDPLGLPRGRRLDVRDGEAVRATVQAYRPDVIIHCAGSNQPKETMETVIRQGTAHIVAAARDAGARLVHISTDVVFGGDKAPYREPDPPAPIHAYGRAKAEAERIVADYGDAVIIRTSLIYGLEEMDRGTAWVTESLASGKPVTLFTDQLRNPVWVNSLSEACLELASGEFHGILHIAGGQCLSRADFALRLLDYWQVEERQGLQFGTCDPHRWPLDTCLDITLAQSLLETPMPGVDEVLASWRPTTSS